MKTITTIEQLLHVAATNQTVIDPDPSHPGYDTHPTFSRDWKLEIEDLPQYQYMTRTHEYIGNSWDDTESWDNMGRPIITFELS